MQQGLKIDDFQLNRGFTFGGGGKGTHFHLKCAQSGLLNIVYRKDVYMCTFAKKCVLSAKASKIFCTKECAIVHFLPKLCTRCTFYPFLATTCANVYFVYPFPPVHSKIFAFSRLRFQKMAILRGVVNCFNFSTTCGRKGV